MKRQLVSLVAFISISFIPILQSKFALSVPFQGELTLEYNPYLDTRWEINLLERSGDSGFECMARSTLDQVLLQCGNKI